MAKGKRPLFELECSECKKRNYISNRNVAETKEKLELKKYCSKCRKHTIHKEKKIVYKKK
jgi:large subunit ribosomal protein L33